MFSASVYPKIAAQKLDHLLFVAQRFTNKDILQRQQRTHIFLRCKLIQQIFNLLSATALAGLHSEFAACLAVQLTKLTFYRRNAWTAHTQLIES